MERTGQLDYNEVFIERVGQIIMDNFQNEHFSVSKLAEMVGISRSQLHRKLKQIKSQSASQFINEIRLKEAYKLLQKEGSTASEVAYDVGFNNPSYFNSCFHKYYGFTPGEVKHHNTNDL